MIDNTIKLVVGSWKAYNECNARGLGSKWLDLSDFNSKEEIVEELKKEGFTNEELEELFIQDIESDLDLADYDYINPLKLWELLEKNGFFADDHKAINIIIESNNYSTNQFLKFLEEERIGDYELFEGSKADYERNAIESCYDIPKWLLDYIDFEKLAEDSEEEEIEIGGNTYTYRAL